VHELLDYVNFEVCHIALHHFTDSDLISDVVEHIWELAVLDPVVLL